MAKPPPRASRSESRPATSKPGTQGNWRRSQKAGGGSFWDLFFRRSSGSGSGAPRTSDPQRKRYAFRIRLLGGAITVVILIAALIIALRRNPIQTPLVAVAVSGYAFPIPPNGYAFEDLRGLKAFEYREEGATRRNLRWVGNPSGEPLRRGDLLKEINAGLDDRNCVPGGRGKNVVLVYVSAHGVVNGKGEACLLTPDSDPLDSQTWAPLQSLLESLRKHERFGADSKTKTVLFLDCSRATDEWQLGQIYNSFAARLPQEMKDAKHPGLIVVSSAGPGQVSWTAPALGGSVFGFYLKVGLGGAADNNNDGDVALGELDAYLKRHVGDWTRTHYNAEQTPQVIGTASQLDNLKLVYTTSADRLDARLMSVAVERERKRREGEIDAARQQALRNSAVLAKLYREQAALVPEGNGLHPASVDPLGWARLRQKLLHLERLLGAGGGYQSEFDQTAKDVDLLIAGLRKPRLDLARWAVSLAQGAQLSPDRTSASQQLAETWDAAVKSADKGGLKRDQLAAAIAKLPATSGQTSPGNMSAATEPVEVRFLRMLAAYAPEGAGVDLEFAPAIRARRLAERAAAPADLRTHHWIQKLVDAGDAQRRLAEDRLFIGSPQALEQLQASWPRLTGETKATDGYQGAELIAKKLAETLRLRDESLADALYLAAWASSRHNTARAADVASYEAWIASLHKLSAQVHAPENVDDPASLRDLDEPRNVLSGRRTDLAISYSTVQAEALGKRIDQSEAGMIEQLLRLPPLDRAIAFSLHGNEDVRGKFLEYLFSRQQPTQDKTAAKPESGGEAAEEKYLQELWRHRLGLTTLKLAPKGNSDDSQPQNPSNDESLWLALAEQGEQLRLALAGVEKRAETGQNEALKPLVEQAEVLTSGETSFAPARERERQLALRIRRSLSELDVMVRSAAALLPKRLPIDSALTLAKLDARTEFLWHGQRVLDDFWGPATAGQTELYFVRAARQCFDGADAAWPEKTERAPLGASLLALHRRRESAAEMNRGVLPIPLEIQLDTEVQKLSHRTRLAIDGDVPPGEAALFVLRSGQRSSPLPMYAETGGDNSTLWRQGAPIPPFDPANPRLESSGVAHRLARTDVETAPVLEAATLYRGHLRKRDFRIYQPGQGAVVAFAKPPLTPPRITVSGAERQAKAVVFIFDFSGSMSRLVKDGEVGLRPRIDVARDAIDAILRQLPDENFQVELRGYGHRAGWTRTQPLQVVYANPTLEVQAEIQRNLFAAGKGRVRHPLCPTNDVETIVKLRPLDDGLRTAIRLRLDGLRPFGETPLCYAIEQAFEELSDERYAAVAERQIVVLTDGLNEQIRTADEVDRDALRAESQLIAYLNRHQSRFTNIKLEIVGFAIGDQEDRFSPAEIAARVKLLKQIAEMQKGKFREANNLTTLIAELNKSLVVPTYKVWPAQQQAATVETRLGKSWQEDRWVPPPRKEGARYLISLADPAAKPFDVDLEGGESLRLFAQGLDLLHEFYAPPNRHVEAESDADGGPYHVTAFVPERRGSTIEFPLAVQHTQKQARLFTGRPRHVWAEIEPTDFQVEPAEPPPTFYCFDPIFEVDTPKPVLRFRVQAWPAGAKKARIRLWFRTHEDPRSPAAEILPWDGSDVRDLTAANCKGVKFNVSTRKGPGAIEIRVTEQNTTSGSIPLRLRTIPAPDKGEHVFFTELKKTEHRFTYFGAEPGKVEIEVTSRDDMQAGALTLTQGRPLEVKLPPQ